MKIKGYNISNGARKIIFLLFFALLVFFGLFVRITLWPEVRKEDGVGSFEPIISSGDGETKKDAKEVIFTNQNYVLPIEKVVVPIKRLGKKDIDIAVKSALAIDDATGNIIYEKEADKKLPVASLTKLTTALAILELADKSKDDIVKTKEKAYNLDRTITVSAYAISQEGNSGSLVEGEKIKARDLFSAMLIASSNDAAWALAEDAAMNLKNGGKASDFVDFMNFFAKNEGLADTHFSNPTGLDDKDNYSSAWDVVKITQKFLRYYPDLFAITAIERMDIDSEDGKIRHHVENTNQLLGETPGIMGGKTGYTDEAGESLMLVVKNPANNSRIIAVLIGADDRFEEMKKLVNWAWDTYEWK